MKTKLTKLDTEVKKTLTASAYYNPDEVKQNFVKDKAKSFKHQKKSPKLFNGSELKQIPEPNRGSFKASMATRFLERGLGTIPEVDSAAKEKKRSDGYMLKRITELNIDRDTKSCDEAKGRTDSPDSGANTPTSMNISAILKKKLSDKSKFSLMKDSPKDSPKFQPGKSDSISTFLDKNLISPKPVASLGKDLGLSGFRNPKGPLKVTDLSVTPQTTTTDETLSSKDPKVHESPSEEKKVSNEEKTSTNGEKASASGEKTQGDAEISREYNARQGQTKGKSKRANSVSLFKKLEGNEKYELDRFPSLSREVSPERVNQSPETKQSEKQKAIDVLLAQTKPSIKKVSIKKTFEEDRQFTAEGETSKDESTPKKNIFYESPTLKGYNSDTSTKNGMKQMA